MTEQRDAGADDRQQIDVDALQRAAVELLLPAQEVRETAVRLGGHAPDAGIAAAEPVTELQKVAVDALHGLALGLEHSSQLLRLAAARYGVADDEVRRTFGNEQSSQARRALLEDGPGR